MARWQDLGLRTRVLVIGAVAAALVVLAVVLTGDDTLDPVPSLPGTSPTSTASATAPAPTPTDATESVGPPAPTEKEPAPPAEGSEPAAGTDPVPAPPPGGSVPVPPQPLPPTVSTLGSGPVPVTDGVTASVTSVRAVTATASAPGERSGPAVAVTVRIANTGSSDFDLTYTSVAVYYGTEGFPASLVLSDPASRPFDGRVRAGAAAEATYVALVPAEERDLVAVVVQVLGAPDVIFEGPAT